MARRLRCGAVVAVSVLAAAAAPASGRAGDGSPPSNAGEYLRCKQTHRCPMAFSSYNVSSASAAFWSTPYASGRVDGAGVFSDFEDWLEGGRGWGGGTMERRAHFGSFNFSLLGALESGWSGAETLSLDTSSLQGSVALANGTSVWNFTGVNSTTASGTQVAVFNFHYIRLGAQCSVELRGARALALLSRSSVELGTSIVARPGTLGGFPGGALAGANNVNGPGSASRRVYLWTVATSGADVREVQTVRTWARAGQTLGGSFVVSFRGRETAPLPHDASAELFKARLERASRDVGTVAVSRGPRGPEGGYLWTISFLSAIGDLPELAVRASLSGIGAGAAAATLVHGNDVSASSFTVRFLNRTAGPVPFSASSQELSRLLLAGLGPAVETAVVQRSDPATDDDLAPPQRAFGACDHGLCRDGPRAAKGLVWTLTLTTRLGLVTPSSPTSALAGAAAPPEALSVALAASAGLGAAVQALPGHQLLVHAESFADAAPGGVTANLTLNASAVFTLAYGGSGASYARPGATSAGAVLRTGVRYAGQPSAAATALLAAAHAAGNTYADTALTDDLLGGSGGAVGGVSVRSILAGSPAAGRGGAGGGAIEIVAVNDVTLLAGARIAAPGEDGFDAFWGGGGGSGGAVLLAAGGSLWVQTNATLEAPGGRGGRSTAFGWERGERADGSGGRVAVFAKSARLDGALPAGEVAGHSESAPALDAVVLGAGSAHLETLLGPQVSVDLIGAAGTSRSLRVTTDEWVLTRSGTRRRAALAMNGPVFQLVSYGNASTSRPNRVSLFVRLGARTAGSVRDVATAMVALHDADWLAGTQATAQAMVAVAAVQGEWRHGAGVVTVPQLAFHGAVEQQRWYKLDLLLDWAAQSYTVRLDDVELVLAAPFRGSSLAAIGLYGVDAGTTWFDEVFAGRDDGAGFRCPRTAAKAPAQGSAGTSAGRGSVGEVRMARPAQTDWADAWLGPATSTEPITRHDSHLSARALYAPAGTSGIAFGSGGRNTRFLSDVGQDNARRKARAGRVNSGVLLRTPGAAPADVPDDLLGRAKTTAGSAAWGSGAARPSGRPSAASGRVYWYGEHVNPAGNASGEEPLAGGIMACSTTDYVLWRNEGTMVHFANISYGGGVPRLRVEVLGGYDGVGVPTHGRRHAVEVAVEETVRVGEWANQPLAAERPKVLFNAATGKYVMWAEVHDASGELGVAMVATSDLPGGPFELQGTFLPDGNETHDQTIIKKADGTALLVRTYLATVDYVLPEPVMQPMWESVKHANGSVDFGLNYHRATYKQSYDDSNDICIQRLRKEDKPAQMLRLPATSPESWISIMYEGEGRLEHFVEAEQAEPWVTKTLLGAGAPVIDSRFKHPNWTYNNEWTPTSVPAVKAQAWMWNYADNNIADNVVLPTQRDKLIGPPRVVESRRARYIAVSTLTPDYLHTSGVLSVYEGFLESGQDLAAVLSDLNGLRLDATPAPIWYERRFFPGTCDGGTLDDEWEDCNAAQPRLQQSTAPGQVWGLSAPFNFVTEYDWSWRYHQFRWNVTDRRPAPVNFRDQLVPEFVPGRGASRTCKGRDFFREIDWNCYRGPNNYPPSDPRHVPAHPLFHHALSQHWTKTAGANLSETTQHLYYW